MVTHNVHERTLRAEPGEAGLLIDGLAGKEDQLWPSYRWPAMRFDRPLAVGASGGHGPIRYDIEAYDPSQRIVFRFTDPAGFDGSHEFRVTTDANGATVLRHTISMTTSGTARLTWPLIIRPLHDALMEDALDCAEASLTGAEPRPRRLSRWVRLLRRRMRR